MFSISQPANLCYGLLIFKKEPAGWVRIRNCVNMCYALVLAISEGLLPCFAMLSQGSSLKTAWLLREWPRRFSSNRLVAEDLGGEILGESVIFLMVRTCYRLI